MTCTQHSFFLLLIALCLAAPLAGARPVAGLAVDAQGRAYFLDAGGQSILRFADGKVTTLFAFDPAVHGTGFRQLVADATGALYTAPATGERVWRVTTDGSISGYYPAADAGVVPPVGRSGEPFAVDLSGNLVAVDHALRARLLVLTPEGDVVERRGGSEGERDGDLRDGAFCIEPDGSVIALAGSSRVLRVAPDGTETILAGQLARGFEDGPGEGARFASPTGVIRDRDGSLLVTDRGNHRIRRVQPSGEVSTVRDLGWRSYPSSVAIAPSGDMLILEDNGEFVRLWRLTSDGDLRQECAVGSHPRWWYLVIPLFMTAVVLAFMLGGAMIVIRRQRRAVAALSAQPA